MQNSDTYTNNTKVFNADPRDSTKSLTELRILKIFRSLDVNRRLMLTTELFIDACSHIQRELVKEWCYKLDIELNKDRWFPYPAPRDASGIASHYIDNRPAFMPITELQNITDNPELTAYSNYDRGLWSLNKYINALQQDLGMNLSDNVINKIRHYAMSKNLTFAKLKQIIDIEKVSVERRSREPILNDESLVPTEVCKWGKRNEQFSNNQNHNESTQYDIYEKRRSVFSQQNDHSYEPQCTGKKHFNEEIFSRNIRDSVKSLFIEKPEVKQQINIFNNTNLMDFSSKRDSQSSTISCGNKDINTKSCFPHYINNVCQNTMEEQPNQISQNKINESIEHSSDIKPIRVSQTVFSKSSDEKFNNQIRELKLAAGDIRVRSSRIDDHQNISFTQPCVEYEINNTIRDFLDGNTSAYEFRVILQRNYNIQMTAELDSAIRKQSASNDIGFAALKGALSRAS